MPLYLNEVIFPVVNVPFIGGSERTMSINPSDNDPTSPSDRETVF